MVDHDMAMVEGRGSSGGSQEEENWQVGLEAVQRVDASRTHGSGSDRMEPLGDVNAIYLCGMRIHTEPRMGSDDRSATSSPCVSPRVVHHCRFCHAGTGDRGPPQFEGPANKLLEAETIFHFGAVNTLLVCMFCLAVRESRSRLLALSQRFLRILSYLLLR